MAGASIETTLELWASSLREVKARMRPLFAQQRAAVSAGLFLDGLLSDERRKTGWMRAEAAGDPGPWRQQAVLGRGRWDADALRDIVRDYALETLADPDAVLVIDETGFLKQGKGSCGVARQYTGSAGKITNCQIGDKVLIRPGCIMEDSVVADGAQLGPYSHLRPGSDIGEGAHVGNFVETKKTRLGKGSKANHLSYLGDAVIGEGVNIGAGTITCNYDGVNKHQSVIEDGVFVGSDSTLVAPVKLGKGAYVGAGSCITDEVPADALALGRSRQVNKPNWACEKREKMKAAKKS